MTELELLKFKNGNQSREITRLRKFEHAVKEVVIREVVKLQTKVVEVPVEIVKEVKVGMTASEMMAFLMTDEGQALAQEAKEQLEANKIKEEILKMMEAEGIDVSALTSPRTVVRKAGRSEKPANNELLDSLCTKENIWFIKRWKSLCDLSYSVELIDGTFTAISAFRTQMKTFKTEAEAVKYIEFLKGAKARDHFRRVKTRFLGADEAELNKRFKAVL